MSHNHVTAVIKQDGSCPACSRITGAAEQVPEEKRPYHRGLLSGTILAQRVLDLEYYTERKQSVPEAVPDMVPMDLADRRLWLKGFAEGIRGTADQE